jgi:hypothetical protein
MGTVSGNKSSYYYTGVFQRGFSGQPQAIALLLRIFIYVKPVVPAAGKALAGFRLFGRS